MENRDNSPQQEVNILKIGFTNILCILWSWFWRSIILTLAVMIVSGIVGGLLGFLTTILFPIARSQQHMIIFNIVGFIIGAFIGFLSLAFFIRWLTTVDLGGYRFKLIKK